MPKHLNIIVKDNGRGIPNEHENDEFTFDGFDFNRIYYPNIDRVIFVNPRHYNSLDGLTLGKVYPILKLLYQKPSPRIWVGLKNDFGELRYYPYMVFRFYRNEF